MYASQNSNNDGLLIVDKIYLVLIDDHFKTYLWNERNDEQVHCDDSCFFVKVIVLDLRFSDRDSLSNKPAIQNVSDLVTNMISQSSQLSSVNLFADRAHR